MKCALALAAGLLACGGAAAAAPPDWPCVQRLVPVLTAGTYWNGVSPTDDGDWHADKDVAAVVAAVSPRAVPLGQGNAMLDAFASGLAPDRRAAALREVFGGLVDETNRQRGEVIARIAELARRQRDVGELVGRVSDELRAIPPDATGEDATRREEIIQRRAMVIRIFDDTERTVRYACDVPVQLEARLGAYARILQGKS